MRALTVALNTYREAVRDKILYVLLFFAGATILASKALGYVSMGEDLNFYRAPRGTFDTEAVNVPDNGRYLV